MPSPFDAFDATLSREVMSAFGETVAATLRPRAPSQYANRAVDITRTNIAIRGIFSAGPDEGQLRGNSLDEFRGTTRLAQTAAEFWVPASEVAAIPYKITQGDLVEIMGRSPSIYCIVRVQWTDLGDANLVLVVEDR